MGKLFFGIAFLLLISLTFFACSQKEGERCQKNSDCEPMVCVGSSDIGETGESGHCCEICDNGVEYWEVGDDSNEGSCGCTSGSGDGDADADADADADSDADADADADAVDAEVDAEG